MKINGVNRIGGVSPYLKQDTKPAEWKGKRESQKDEVQISAQAQELHEAQSSQGMQEVRRQKLHDLKQSVSTGTYYVDAGQIAEKLLPYIKLP